MAVTIADSPVTGAEIHEPLFGRWFADVVADSLDDITGAVTLSVEGVDFVGTVHRGGLESGHWVGRVVGGAGGLSTVVAAKQYRSSNVRGLVEELATASGETLDVDGSDAATLARVIPRWHRARGTVGAALMMLTRQLASSWRMSRAGQIVMGADTWPELAENAGTVETATEPGLGITTVAPPTPELRPGVTYQGERVSYVVTRVSGGSLRQEAWRA